MTKYNQYFFQNYIPFRKAILILKQIKRNTFPRFKGSTLETKFPLLSLIFGNVYEMDSFYSVLISFLLPKHRFFE